MQISAILCLATYDRFCADGTHKLWPFIWHHELSHQKTLNINIKSSNVAKFKICHRKLKF